MGDEDLVNHFEKNKKTIAQYLRLSELPDDIKGTIRQNPEKLSTRVIFREVFAKCSTPGEIRKAINRKIETQKPDGDRSKRTKVKEQLQVFFEQEKLHRRKRYRYRSVRIHWFIEVIRWKTRLPRSRNTAFL